MKKLEDFNLGEPTCPDIIINKEGEASDIEPQAWEYEGNWYYNWEGAMTEADFLGKKIPSQYEWDIICDDYGKARLRMVTELGLSFEGYRHRTTGNYNDKNINTTYWSSSCSDNNNASYLCFNKNHIVTMDDIRKSFGCSVRCFKD